jgi:ADP-ribose pyrophosphatase YjhB (NUDIX family)
MSFVRRVRHFADSLPLVPSRTAAHDTAMPTFEHRIPDGDNRERMICADCGHIDYQNPKVVVGAVVTSNEKILMCRRAIEPRSGFWTLPAGYLELGETLEEGAARETMEEATADIRLDGILAVFSVARIGQVQVIFRARFADPDRPAFAAGPESLEVALFAWDEIPWSEIAFPTVHWALNAWNERRSGPLGVPAGNPSNDQRGVHPLVSMPKGRP